MVSILPFPPSLLIHQTSTTNFPTPRRNLKLLLPPRQVLWLHITTIPPLRHPRRRRRNNRPNPIRLPRRPLRPTSPNLHLRPHHLHHRRNNDDRHPRRHTSRSSSGFLHDQRSTHLLRRPPLPHRHKRSRLHQENDLRRSLPDRILCG